MVADRVMGAAMTTCLASRRVARCSATTPTLTAVVTLREGTAEPAGGLAWSHDGHIRSCDLAASGGSQCHPE